MKTGPSSFNYLDETEGFRRFVHWNQWVLLAATLVSLLSVVFATPTQWGRYIPVCTMALVLGLSHLQMRHSPRRAIMVLVLGTWLMASATVLQFSGVYTSLAIIFPFTIAMAGWVLGGRWLTFMTLATVVFFIAVGTAQMMGMFHPTPRAPPALVMVPIVAMIGVISFLTYAARQSLLNSRNRALQLSADLAQQNQDIALRERDLNLLLNNVPAAVASFDSQGLLRRCNPRYAHLFGVEPSAIVGKSFTEYSPPQVLEQVLPYWNKAMTGAAQNYRRLQPDIVTGATRWIEASVLPEIEGGAVIGLFAVFVDVTDKVKAETEILALNTELEQRVARRTAELAHAMETLQESREELVRSQARATLSVLIASVSHELSTPIGNSLLVATSLAELSAELQQQLDTGQLKKSTLLELNRTLAHGGQLLVSNLDRAKDLIKNFKQVSADQASEQRRSFDLAEVVAEVVSSLSPSLKTAPHHVVQAIAPGIVMDSLPGPLGQVVINLVNNAYLHAFEGRSDGVLTIGAELKGQEVYLRFADNGVGMTPSVLQHLFDPFFSTKVGKGGTGLGMGIVHSLVRKPLGGSLHVQSVLGQGTTFELHLPLVAPAAAPSTQPAPLGLA